MATPSDNNPTEDVPADANHATVSVADSAAPSGSDADFPSTAEALSASSERYTLEREIARGGMGTIYKARDSVLNRVVVLKVLKKKYASHAAATRRFNDEARIAAQLQHPAIPPIHDLGKLPDGRSFLAMKLIEGETLDDLLLTRSASDLDHGRYLAVFEQVCHALAFAHDRQVIHRDLKPANIMVGSFGEVQVMDWGLAKVIREAESTSEIEDPNATLGTEILPGDEADESRTQAGSVLGTPAYMPPEQAVGAIGQIDQRSDVFGLGAILAVILTGKPPFVGSSSESTRVLAAQGKVDGCMARLDACGADPELVALCKRCLSPLQADRPRDAGEVAHAVTGLRAAADERARQAELERIRTEGDLRASQMRTAEQRKRRKTQALLGLCFTALVLLGVSFVWWTQNQSLVREAEDHVQRAARERAERERRAASDAEVNRAVEEAVSRFSRASAAQHDHVLWKQARDAAIQAETRAIAAEASPEVRERIRHLLGEIEQVEKNRRLVSALLEIHTGMGDQIMPLTGDQDFAGADARYTQAFRDYGTDLFALSAAAGSELLNTLGSNVRAELAAAIDDWGYVRYVLKSGNYPHLNTVHLFEITKLFDPDAIRNQIRDRIVAQDSSALVRLAGEIDPAKQPVQTVNLLAVYMYWFGEVDQAARFLQKAQPHHPNDFQINHNLAWFFLYKAQTSQALPYCVAAIALRPRSASAWLDYARALVKLKRNDEAVAAYRRVITLCPGSYLVLPELKKQLNKMGDETAANAIDGECISCLEAAIRRHPRNVKLHRLLVEHVLKLGEDRAIAYFRGLVTRNPRDAFVHADLAKSLESKYELEDARNEYREACRLEPGIAVWHDWIAWLNLQLNEPQAALAAARESVRLNSDDLVNVSPCHLVTLSLL